MPPSTEPPVLTGKPPEKPYGYTANTLKLIAIAAMLIDHVAHAFLPPESPLYLVMRFIGRITGPTMFFFAVEGYHHTRNINRYLLRLGVFTLVSYFPFLLFSAGGIPANIDFLKLNVIYTIFLGVLAIRVRREMNNPVLKVVLLLALVILSFCGDWAIYGVIIILVFDFYRDSFRNQAFGYTLVVFLGMGILSMLVMPINQLVYGMEIGVTFYLQSAINVGMFLPLLLLRSYNGEKGGGGKWMKWAFYVFYPAHLLVIGLIQFLLAR